MTSQHKRKVPLSGRKKEIVSNYTSAQTSIFQTPRAPYIDLNSTKKVFLNVAKLSSKHTPRDSTVSSAHLSRDKQESRNAATKMAPVKEAESFVGKKFGELESIKLPKFQAIKQRKFTLEEPKFNFMHADLSPN